MKIIYDVLHQTLSHIEESDKDKIKIQTSVIENGYSYKLEVYVGSLKILYIICDDFKELNKTFLALLTTIDRYGINVSSMLGSIDRAVG